MPSRTSALSDRSHDRNRSHEKHWRKNMARAQEAKVKDAAKMFELQKKNMSRFHASISVPVSTPLLQGASPELSKSTNMGLSGGSASPALRSPRSPTIRKIPGVAPASRIKRPLFYRPEFLTASKVSRPPPSKVVRGDGGQNLYWRALDEVPSPSGSDEDYPTQAPSPKQSKAIRLGGDVKYMSSVQHKLGVLRSMTFAVRRKTNRRGNASSGRKSRRRQASESQRSRSDPNEEGNVEETKHEHLRKVPLTLLSPRASPLSPGSTKEHCEQILLHEKPPSSVVLNFSEEKVNPALTDPIVGEEYPSPPLDSCATFTAAHSWVPAKSAVQRAGAGGAMAIESSRGASAFREHLKDASTNASSLCPSATKAPEQFGASFSDVGASSLPSSASTSPVLAAVHTPQSYQHTRGSLGSSLFGVSDSRKSAPNQPTTLKLAQKLMGWGSKKPVLIKAPQHKPLPRFASPIRRSHLRAREAADAANALASGHQTMGDNQAKIGNGGRGIFPEYIWNRDDFKEEFEKSETEVCLDILVTATEERTPLHIRRLVQRKSRSDPPLPTSSPYLKFLLGSNTSSGSAPTAAANAVGSNKFELAVPAHPDHLAGSHSTSSTAQQVKSSTVPRQREEMIQSSRIEFLAKLPPSLLEDVCHLLQANLVEAGTVFYRQGDEGGVVFMLHAGCVETFREAGEGGSVKNELLSGQTFGGPEAVASTSLPERVAKQQWKQHTTRLWSRIRSEVLKKKKSDASSRFADLMHNPTAFLDPIPFQQTPRQETAVARTRCIVFSLSLVQYNALEFRYTQKLARETVSMLRKMECFRGWDNGRLHHLQNVLLPKTFRKGDTIWRQGDPSNFMCIVQHGDVSMSRKVEITTTKRWKPASHSRVWRREESTFVQDIPIQLPVTSLSMESPSKLAKSRAPILLGLEALVSADKVSIQQLLSRSKEERPRGSGGFVHNYTLTAQSPVKCFFLMSRYFYQFSSKEVTALREEDTAHRLKAVAAVHQMLCQKHPQHSTAKPIPCIDWALFGFDEDETIYTGARDSEENRPAFYVPAAERKKKHKLKFLGLKPGSVFIRFHPPPPPLPVKIANSALMSGAGLRTKNARKPFFNLERIKKQIELESAKKAAELFAMEASQVKQPKQKEVLEFILSTGNTAPPQRIWSSKVDQPPDKKLQNNLDENLQTRVEVTPAEAVFVPPPPSYENLNEPECLQVTTTSGMPQTLSNSLSKQADHSTPSRNRTPLPPASPRSNSAVSHPRPRRVSLIHSTRVIVQRN